MFGKVNSDQHQNLITSTRSPTPTVIGRHS